MKYLKISIIVIALYVGAIGLYNSQKPVTYNAEISEEVKTERVEEMDNKRLKKYLDSEEMQQKMIVEAVIMEQKDLIAANKIEIESLEERINSLKSANATSTNYITELQTKGFPAVVK